MSFKNYKRSIVLDFDYNSVKQGVPEANKQMALLNSEFRKTSEVVNQTGYTMDKLGLQQDTLTNKVSIQKNKIESLKNEISKLDKEDSKHSKTLTRKTIELNNAESTLLKYEKQLDNVNDELLKQETLLGKAKTAYADFAKEAERAGVDMDNLNRNLERTGMVLASVGIAGLKMSGDLEQVLAKSATIADTSVVSMEDLRKGVLDLSKDYNIAATSIGEGLYNILSGNVKTTDSLIVLENATKLSKAGFTDMETAAQLLTKTINAYGLSIDEVSLVTDKFINMQKLGQITVGEFGEQFGKIAGLAATAKIPLDEVMASVSTLTAMSSQPAEAVTALRAILQQVIKPSQQATEAAKEYGVQLNLAALQSKGLAGWLEHLNQRTRGSEQAMTEMFGSVNALNSVFLLTGEGSNKFSEDIFEIGKSMGFADDAILALNNNAEKFSNALNKLKISLIEAGDSLVPILNMITGLLNILAHIPSSVIAALAVAGAILAITIKIAKAIEGLSTFSKGLSTVFDMSLSPSTLKLLGYLLLVAGALTAILTLIAAITGKADDVGKIADNISQSQQNLNNQITQGSQNVNRRTTRGSHALGLSRVPADGDYTLHQNEEVLTKDDPRNSNNPNYGNENQNINVYVSANDLQQVADLVRLFENLKRNKRMG